ncbi:MAG: hypothetical protein KAG53_02060 [Endozoicomonadaceae bacterium]|nr:hypothetical protein [Endozoicomonadaceae bacterium]
MPQISMLRPNQSDEEVSKSLSQYSSISAVKPSCTYNIFRLWFGAEGIMNYMLWANLIQDHRLNPSSNVYLIIDSEDHSENTNQKINDLSKEFGIHLLDINCPTISYNTIITSDLVEKIKQCKNDKSMGYSIRKDWVQVYLCTMVPYCATFDIDLRLLKPIEDIVRQKKKAYNDIGAREKNRPKFVKIIVRMKETCAFDRVYQNTNDILLDAFINSRKN